MPSYNVGVDVGMKSGSPTHVILHISDEEGRSLELEMSGGEANTLADQLNSAAETLIDPLRRDDG